LSARVDPDRLAARRAQLPPLSLPAELPIAARAEEIVAALRSHPVLVVAGETGSGKSTQLAKLALLAGGGTQGRIAHTQPRRVAARAIATRVAAELGVPLGSAVGYKVRFSDWTAPDTLIKVLTDGMLLAEFGTDPLLREYDTVIVDEAHERSLNIDLLLGCLIRLRARRPELRVIVTSATLDVERMAAHLGGAPVISVEGRLHPVELRWRPGEEGVELTEQVVAAVREAEAERSGDLLVFLPGEREIRDCSHALRDQHLPHTEVLPLYARLTPAEQDRVFHPGPSRRVVLATNVAETALTVPRVRVVIDAGTARIARYSHRAKLQRLRIEPISQASATQRAGRCGRIGPGLCIRLYAEEDHAARPAFTMPEVQRTNLAAVILQMAVLGLGDIEAFPWLDAPDGRYVRDGLRLLRALGAFDAEDRPTPLGRRMARLPVDPRFARMLLAARERGVLADMLVIVAGLTVQDPRLRPAGSEAAADQAHAQWHDPASDFLAMLRLWQGWQEAARHLSRSKQRAWCATRFLSLLRLREWGDIHSQLSATLADAGAAAPAAASAAAVLHECLLTGLLDHVGLRDEQRDYQGVRGLRFQPFPGSGVKPLPRWLVAAELVETSRVWARSIARVEPEWIERAAGDQLSVHHGDPHWDQRSGRVMARATVSLYGLILAVGRRVDYGRVAPADARVIFLRDALAADALGLELPCLAHNRTLIAELRRVEAKLRQRDTLVDEAALTAAYARRVPDTVHDRKGLQTWYGATRRAGEWPLRFSAAELGGQAEAPGCPDQLTVNGVALPLEYRYAPGAEEDGITLSVPLAMLAQLEADRLDWLVPGWHATLITELIRGLPKELRRQLVPAPTLAAELLDAGLDTTLPRAAALSAAVRRVRGVLVPAGAWDAVVLPTSLVMRVSVRAADGAELAAGRDLAALRETLAPAAALEVTRGVSEAWPAREFRHSDFGHIPRVSRVRRGLQDVVMFPALEDRGVCVAAVLCDSEVRAAQLTWLALRRLAALALDRELRYLKRHALGVDALLATLKPLADAETWRTDLGHAALQACIDFGDPTLRQAEACAARIETARPVLVATATELIADFLPVASAWQAAQSAIGRLTGPALATTRADLERQSASLIHPGCLSGIPVARWPDLERYLKGMRLRADKAGNAPAKDGSKLAELTPFLTRFEALRAGRSLADLPAELQALFWLLEEQRIASFAQPLKTAVPVSTQRLARAFESLSPAASGSGAGL
jgi:ATP-dependent helicase HrpA